MTSRHLDAATVLLLEHYDMEQAQRVAADLEQKVQAAGGGPTDVVHLAATMYEQAEPWWDSEDAKVRAIHQLQMRTLLLPSIEALVEDVEAGLGRELAGESTDDKIKELSFHAGQILAELQGEEYVDPLQTLLAQLKGMMPPPEDVIDVEGEVPAGEPSAGGECG